ncbi:MAG: photosynthetic reaction center cytochrome c subunit family protein [Acidobacteria bacterium]|nr:photosynthetic reaction center cytochrome c subunit family protein [Acidobacteriota bacterium]
MSFRSGRTFAGAAAIAAVCLLGVSIAGGRTTFAQEPPARAQVVEDVFSSVSILRGIPVDNFFETMGMFAAAMGNDCTFCHVKEAYFGAAAFADPTPRIQRARQMIVMMNTVNKTYFGGQSRVTCFTCHGGSNVPKEEPILSLQYGPPVENPNERGFPVYEQESADQVFDRYIAAIGGAERVAALSSFTATGTYQGFDTAFSEVPVELYANAPNQAAMVVQMFNGPSFRSYDGRSGWMAGPDTPVPLLTLTGGNLGRARAQAIVSFPAGIRDAFSQWRVGRTDIDDREVRIVQGSDGEQPLVNLYFERAGLLVRMVTWTGTPAGVVPTQVDYSDYREVAGVMMPFSWTVSQTYMQMTVSLSEVRPNVAIEAARFAQPAPSVPQ